MTVRKPCSGLSVRILVPWLMWRVDTYLGVSCKVPHVFCGSSTRIITFFLFVFFYYHNFFCFVIFLILKKKL